MTTSSTRHQHFHLKLKKSVLYIEHIPQQKLSFIGNLKIKPLTCFKHQINPRSTFDMIFVVLYDGGAIRK